MPRGLNGWPSGPMIEVPTTWKRPSPAGTGTVVVVVAGEVVVVVGTVEVVVVVGTVVEVVEVAPDVVDVVVAFFA